MKTTIKTVHIFSTSAINLGLVREYFRGKQLRVPACVGCSTTLKRSKRVSWLVYAGAGLLAIVLVRALGLQSGSSWPVWGTALAIAAPWFIYRTYLKPIAFDTMVWGDRITYEFARPDFAQRFADKNGGRVE